MKILLVGVKGQTLTHFIFRGWNSLGSSRLRECVFFLRICALTDTQKVERKIGAVRGFEQSVFIALRKHEVG